MNQKGSKPPRITTEQLRAARGLLGWAQSRLAKRAGLSASTIKRVEADLGVPVSDNAREGIRQALEAAGVVFLDENGGGVGVRFKQPHRRK